MINVFTIDLEDYFMVSAFESVVRRENWANYESRIERNTYRLLEILAQAKARSLDLENRNPASCTPNPLPGVKATFFCLGWVAELFPRLIKDIHKEGHEIASHGYDHRQIYHMTPSEFRNDIRKTRETLEDIIGERVVGYRAPSYSIIGKTLWAFEILGEEGYCYDSSIFPIYHDRYGFADSPRFPFLIETGGGNIRFMHLEEKGSWPAGDEDLDSLPRGNPVAPRQKNRKACDSLIEFPLSTLRIWKFNIPVSGGGYFRLLPYSFVRKAIRNLNEIQKKVYIFYIHPWEIDPGQPRLKRLPILSRFRHYLNLPRTEERLKKLLHDISFSSFRGFLENNGYHA